MLQIKCRKCKTWNSGGDYCSNCGSVISMEEEERIETEIKKEIERQKPEDKWKLWVKKYKNHKNLIMRGVFYLFYSVYLIFAGIGMFLAWLTLLSQA